MHLRGWQGRCPSFGLQGECRRRRSARSPRHRWRRSTLESFCNRRCCQTCWAAVVGLGIDCETPSGFVKIQVDFVHATMGGVHRSRGHVRCVGECELGQCKHTFLRGHLSCNRAACTSQNRFGCPSLGDHYDPHYKVTERPGDADVYYVTGVQWVYDEV